MADATLPSLRRRAALLDRRRDRRQNPPRRYDRHAGQAPGQRGHGAVLLDDGARSGTEGCSYLLGVDVDMNTVAATRSPSWDSGYGDFVFQPDLATLRLVPWHPATRDDPLHMLYHDGSPVAQSPRRSAQAAGAARGLGHEPSWLPSSSSTLQELVCRAVALQVRRARTGHLYNIDYSLFGTPRRARTAPDP